MKAEDFIKKLKERSNEHPKKEVLKFFKDDDGETDALGVKFGTVFKLAKEFTDLPLSEINKLLNNKFYEIRMGAVSIMDFQSKRKSTTEKQRKELYELYLNRHDRLNNWDFVDRGAYNIIGEYLIDKPRDTLYELAKSNDAWKRRTAIVSTYAFIKKGELNDTFKIAEILINDNHELINKAVGSWLREAGKKDRKKLITFLDKHAETMPRVTLRYAIEKFDKPTRKKYLNKGK
ncbi:MAG: DNA alkylation repair protein [Dokdonia sp.]|jgi:3-methyladenine DNA glycosylase AlkD